MSRSEKVMWRLKGPRSQRPELLSFSLTLSSGVIVTEEKEEETRILFTESLEEKVRHGTNAGRAPGGQMPGEQPES